MEDEEVIKKRLRRKEVIEEDRHNELKGALKGIATLLGKPEKDDKAIVDAIKKQGDAIDKVAAAISNQPKPEKPEVNVITDNKELLPLLKEIKEGQIALKEAFENKLMVDEFKFTSDQWGKYNTAKVIYKPMNQVTVSKSKYQA